MKSYIQVWLAIVTTHYHNLNANIKTQDYWLLTSNVGTEIQKALNCSTGLKNIGLFSHILGQFAKHYKERHNQVYTTKFHLMATF
jgi:hypothetical protein